MTDIEAINDAQVSRHSVAIVTGVLDERPNGGRALLSRLNHDALAALIGKSLLAIEIPSRGLRGWRAVKAAFTGHVDGLDEEVISGVVDRLKGAGVGKVLIDGSNFGKLAAGIARCLPGVEVTTFFHNCEARFFLGALRRKPGLRAFGVLLGNYVAERAAVRSSTKRVCLNTRDSELLQSLYGRAATHVSPMAMKDRMSKPARVDAVTSHEPYVLFVGGAFYANLQGIEWYANKVATRAPLATYVVGKGLEHWKPHLERSGRVKVVGAVDDLTPWYVSASAVVAPIFDGSGMKTKVAEALMHGKRVIGTPEAFCGYEDVAGKVGVVCRTPGEFEVALVAESRREFVACDPALRAIYLERYSFDAAKARLAAILDA